MKTEQNSPPLRFPNFNTDWQVQSLGQIAEFSKGKGISKADIADDGELQCIRYGELYTTYDELIEDPISRTNLSLDDVILSKRNDVIIPASGETHIDIATASCVMKEGVAIGGDLNIIRSNVYGVFLSYYLNNARKRKIASLAQGSSVVHLYATQLKTLKLRIPSREEQEQIASFLWSVDEKIAQLSKKKDLLEAYKKGVMQKIFKQEIHFKDDNDKPFPNWKTKHFGEVFERITRKNKENNQNVMTISAQQGLINQEEYFNKSVSAENITGYYLLKKGEFAYNKSYSKGYPMGAIKRLKNYDKGVVSTLYICFRVTGDNLGEFYDQYFDNGGLNREIHKIAQEGARNHGLLNVSVIEFFKDIKLPCPHPGEQKKIVEFLGALDKKIDLVADELKGAQAFKKGLLQQMFV